MTTELKEAAVKQLALARARSAILAADSGKLSEQADVVFAKWSDFNVWLSDADLAKTTRRRMMKTYEALSLMQTG